MLKTALHRAVESIATAETLDGRAATVAESVRRWVGHGRVKDLLSGTWLGHPLHPLLTDVPIGAFTSATVLDLVGGPRSHRAADGFVALGLASSVPTAAAGAADWSHTRGEDQRVGAVHAMANTVGVALYALSLVHRRRGHRKSGAALGLAGMTSMTVGGYLGGSLSYSRGIGVNNTFWLRPPADWTPVLDSSELADGELGVGDAEGVSVLLRRAGGTITGIAARCSHAGGPLGEGEVDETACTVTCPWHRSVVRLDTGEVVHGPATAAQPRFEVRERDGRIEVRAASR